MKCTNCGFDAGEEGVCPICGAECAGEELPAQPERIKISSETEQEKPALQIKKNFFVVLTSIICAVIIACTAFLAVLMINLNKTNEKLYDLFNSEETTFLSDEYGSEKDVVEGISSIIDNTVYKVGEESELSWCALRLESCETGMDYLSSYTDDKLITLSFSLINKTDETLSIKSPDCYMYAGGDYKFHQREFTYETPGEKGTRVGETVIAERFDIKAGQTAELVWKISAPDIDSASVIMSFIEETREVSVVHQYEVECGD